ncbi:MAG: sensor histidine kinase [Ferruginibacter sp.]
MAAFKFRFLFCFLLLLMSLHPYAQLSKLDSLKQNINLSISPSTKLQATISFCDMWESFSPDTLFKYASSAKALAISLNDPDALLIPDYYLAAFLFQKNKLDTALKAINIVIAQAQKKASYNSTLIKFWLLRGNILQRTSHYDQLLLQNLKLLSLAEQHKDTIAIIRFSTSIGNVNMRLKKDSDALRWQYKALALMQSDEVKAECSFVYINIAVIYYHFAVLNDTKQNEDSIEINLQKAIAYSRKGNNLTNLANSLSMYGSVLSEYKKLPLAEAALTEALATRKAIGDVYYEINDMLALASFYENSNNNEKAITTCRQALQLANDNGKDFSSLNAVYSLLGEVYSNEGDYKNYSEVLKEKMHLQDSVYKVNTAEAVTEMEAKYEVEKKQNTIIAQQYSLEKKNYLLYASVLFLITAVVFSLILFKQYRKKQELKMQMLHAEEQRMSRIAAEAAAEQERNRIAAELHDNLGAQLSYISSNINFIIEAPLSLTGDEKDTRLTRLHETAKNSISDLRQTIWALKKDLVVFQELADRLKLYAQNQLAHKKDITLQVEEKIEVNIVFSPADALNLFRIFQEAINNSVKYSEAAQLSLSFASGPGDVYTVSLRDNGKGFDEKAALPGHYGLENMQQRAKDLQAKLDIFTAENKGTHITVTKT